MSNHSKVEILSIKENGEWVTVEMALDSQLVIPFDVHKSDWRSYREVKELEAMLARQAASLLATYGDARQPREEARA